MANEENNTETKKYPSPFKDTDKAIGIFGKAQLTKSGYPRVNCMVGIDDLIAYCEAQKAGGRRVIYINAMESTWDKATKSNTLPRHIQMVAAPVAAPVAPVAAPVAAPAVTPDAIAQAQAILAAAGKTVTQ